MIKPRITGKLFLAPVAVLFLIGIILWRDDIGLGGQQSQLFRTYQTRELTPRVQHWPDAKKDRNRLRGVRIQRDGTDEKSYVLGGAIVDQRGIVKNITTQAKSEFIFSFSPTTEENFKQKMVEPIKGEQKVFANSPAIIWSDNSFVVVMRIWLDKEDTKKHTANIFSDNYFYMRRYNERMEPLDVHGGDVMGIPTQVHKSVGDGPIEPRAFDYYGQFYLSFNSGLSISKTQMVDWTYFWSMDGMRVIFPSIFGNRTIPDAKAKMMSISRDKHWSPYTYNEKVFFVYNMDPFKLMVCDRLASCNIINDDAPSNYVFNPYSDCLRGGTPTLHYKDNYYLSAAHVTLMRHNEEIGWKRTYTVNLYVLRVNSESDHQIIYMSRPLEFNEKKMDSIPQVREEYIERSFLFPVSLLLEDDDTVVIGGHVNDHSSYLIRMNGIKQIMDQVMNHDDIRQQRTKPGFLKHLARQYASEMYNVTFIEK